VVETKPVPEPFGLKKPYMDWPGFKPGPLHRKGGK